MKWEELGFKSQQELDDSIARVERQRKMSNYDLEVERRNKAKSNVNGTRIDIRAIEEGARLAELDRVVLSRIISNERAAKEQEESDKFQMLLNKAADSIQEENQARAEKEIAEEKAKIDKELNQAISKKHNVKTEKEIAEENSYKKNVKRFKALIIDTQASITGCLFLFYGRWWLYEGERVMHLN